MNAHIYREIETILKFTKYIRTQNEDTPSDTRMIYLILEYIKHNFTIEEPTFDDISKKVNEILLDIM